MSVASSHHAEKDHTLLSIFSLTCLALMIAVPFLVTYHMPPIASFFKEWLAAVFGVLAALYLAGRNRAQFQLPVITFVPLLLIVVLGLQIWLLKPDYWQNQFIAMLYLGFSALMILLGSNLRHVLTLEKVVPTLAWAFLIGALTIMILIFISKFIDEGSPLKYWILDGRAGNIGQVNHFSNYIALSLASLLYLRIVGKVKNLPTIIITAIFLIGLAQAGQRMAILYVLLLSVGGCLLMRSIYNQDLSLRPYSLLWLIPGFMAAQLIVPFMTFIEPATMPAKRLIDTMGEDSSRLILLEQGWNAFKTSMWLGIGWGEFAWYNFNVTEQYLSLKGMWSHVHNIVMQLLVETGIVGALIFMAGALYWFRSLFYEKLTPERWWLLALVSILAIHSMLEYPLWYTHFLAYASLLLGLSSEKNLHGRFQLAPVAFAAAFMFGCWSLGNMLMDYRRLEVAINTLREEGVNQKQIEENLVKFNDLRRQTLFTAYADNFFVRVLPNSNAFFADKLTLSRLVVENWPGRVESYMHAFLLAMNDKPVEAQKMMRKAIKQFPEYRKNFHQFVLQRVVKGEELLMPILIIVQDPYLPAEIIENTSK